MLLPFKALLVFEAVARNRSFTQAAEEICVSQSAVSHQIRNLESYFGVRLLDRSGSKVSLTPEGQVLYKDLDLALSMLRIGVGNLKSAISSTPVGVSVRPHFAYKWLSPRLRDADFDFDIRFYHTNEVADFSDPQIHLSIEWLRENQAPPHARLLVPGELTPACHPSLLRGIPDPANPAILQNFTWLRETNDTTWSEWVTRAGFPELQAKGNTYHSDTNVRQQAAIDMLGFALVCPALVTDDIEAERLVCPFDIHLQTYGYYLISPPERMTRLKVRKVADFIMNRCSFRPRPVVASPSSESLGTG